MIINLHSHEETSREGIHSVTLSGYYWTAKTEHDTDFELTTSVQEQGPDRQRINNDLDSAMIELDTMWSDEILVSDLAGQS